MKTDQPIAAMIISQNIRHINEARSKTPQSFAFPYTASVMVRSLFLTKQDQGHHVRIMRLGDFYYIEAPDNDVTYWQQTYKDVCLRTKDQLPIEFKTTIEFNKVMSQRNPLNLTGTGWNHNLDIQTAQQCLRRLMSICEDQADNKYKNQRIMLVKNLAATLLGES